MPFHTKTILTLLSIFSVLFCVGTLTGCSNELDDSKNIFPEDIVEEVAQGGESCSGCPEVGQMYRFDTLIVDKLDNQENPVTDVLNPVWAKDIELYELNIIFEVVEVTDTALNFRAVNAARVGFEGEMCLMGNTAIDMKMNRSGCEIQSSEAAGMNIYSGSETNPKNCVPGHSINAIAVQGVELAASLSEDCGNIINGNIVKAYLPKDFLDRTCSCITTGSDQSDACLMPDPTYEDKSCGGCNDGFVALNTYLKAFSPGGKLDYLCENEDGQPAVCLGGSFSLTRLDAPIEECP